MSTVNAKQLALDIKERFDTDPEMQAVCQASPEFYRACVSESGLINAALIDGTDIYHAIVDELETIM